VYLSVKRRIKKITDKLNIKNIKNRIIIIETDKPYSKEYTTIINGKEKHFDDYDDYLEEYIYRDLTPRERKHIKVIIDDLPKAE